jgi:DNA-binding LacI/PurR family transcriptional regulator
MGIAYPSDIDTFDLGARQNLCKDMVFSDDMQGGQDITRYLIGLGHRYIWFVGNTRLPWFARCFEGYNRAISDAGLTPQHSDIDSEDGAEIGYLGAKSILTSGAPVTAIFAGNDPNAWCLQSG